MIISDGYFDVSTTGQVVGVGESYTGGAPAVATEIGSSTSLSAYAQSTYTGFDFSASGPWVIFEGSTRPMLKFEYSTTITNAHQLQLMLLDPTATYSLATNIDASGTTNPSDVWNTATGFVPVGNGASPFSGTFNGAGHTISNLTIDQPSAYEVGLFGVSAPGSLIENVAMSGGGVTGNTYVGALVGLNQGTLSSVAEVANVAATNAYVGGLVGYNTGAITTGVANGPVSGAYFVGGSVGWNATGGVISGGYASGAVSGDSFAGGLVGYNAGTAVGAGAINPVSATGAYTGGSVGYNSGTLVNLVAYGAVTGGYGAGGLAGGNSGTIYYGYASGPLTGFEDVGGAVGLNSGSVVGSVSSPNVSASNANAGGLVGDNTGSVSYALALGSASAGYNAGGLVGYDEQNATVTTSSAEGAVNGSSNVGGLVGLNAGVVSLSFALGGVTGTNAYAGGLVGYNTGSISNAYSTGAVSGNYYAGGLVGRNDGQTDSAYASGAVSGAAYAAGAVSVNTGSADIVLWDAGTTGQPNGVAYNTGTLSEVYGIGVGGNTDPWSTASYRDTNPYSTDSYDFNFISIWTIQGGVEASIGTSRPYLIANPQSPPPK